MDETAGRRTIRQWVRVQLFFLAWRWWRLLYRLTPKRILAEVMHEAWTLCPAEPQYGNDLAVWQLYHWLADDGVSCEPREDDE